MRKMMFGVVVAALSASALWANAQDHHAPKQPDASPAVKAAFDKLKSLAGDWVAAEPEKGQENQIAVSYKVTAGGSVVQETLFPGQPEEMLTTYCIQDGELMLTHYCMLANQPRMKLDASSGADKLVFKFVNGANINPAKDAHMHDATLTLTGADTFTADWTSWTDGKADDHHASFNFKRKK